MFRVQCCVVVCLLTLIQCRVSTAACNSATEFTCSNGNCIPVRKVNNTVNDCDDNSDEAVTRTCRQGDFTCTGGSCVTPDRWIDGVKDCADGSDEEKAIGTPCSPNITWPKSCESSISNSVCAVTTSPRHSKLNTTCQCLPGWYTNELRMNCTKRKLGDTCNVNDDCFNAVVHTVCYNNSICQCATGYYVTSPTECTARVINDNCTSDADCSAVVAHSHCSSTHQCLCDSNFVASSDLTQCDTPHLNSLQCSTDNYCIQYFNNSKCVSRVCQCDLAYYDNTETTQCYRYQLGSQCQLSTLNCQQAVGNSTCDSSSQGPVCTCQQGFQAEGNNTCSLRKIGGSCVINTDCSGVINAVCNTATGKCECNGPGYLVTNGNTTCTQRRLNDTCSVPGECSAAVANSTCISGQCQCPVGLIAASLTACRHIQFNDPCFNTSQCQLTLGNISQCVNGRCTCIHGYGPTINQDGCRRLPVEDVPCSNNLSCTSLFNNTCCNTPNNKCMCAEHFQLTIDGFGCEIVQLGSHCVNNQRCVSSIVNSACVNNMCTCRNGFYVSVDKQQCVDVVINETRCLQPGTNCKQAVENSVCSSDGVCVCVGGYWPLGGRRCVNTILGDWCLTDTDCSKYLQHTLCNNDSCVCDEGFVSVDKLTCSARPQSFIGLFIGALVATIVTVLVLWRKKLRKKFRKVQKVAPVGMYGMDHRWQLEWSNRPPAHVPVMYKSPALKAPEELYDTNDLTGRDVVVSTAPPCTQLSAVQTQGPCYQTCDLLQLNLQDVVNSMVPNGKHKLISKQQQQQQNSETAFRSRHIDLPTTH